MPVLAVELIVLPLIFMLSPAISCDCLLFKLVSISDIFVEILVFPYTKFGAAMVVPVRPVIFPQSMLPVVILLVEFKLVPPVVAEIILLSILIFSPAVKFDCLLSNDNVIELILSPTFIIPSSSSMLNIFARTSPFLLDLLSFLLKTAKQKVNLK
jgi:hypothetical protein